MRLFLIALFCLAPEAALAEEMRESMSFGGAMLQMLAALALVLGLMVGLYWVMRRLNPRHMLGQSAGGLKVWGRLGLGPKKSLALVEVGRSILVLGLGDKEVSLLKEISDPEEIAELKANSGVGFMRRNKEAQGFMNILKRKREDETS